MTADLIIASDAKLPATYEAAKTALATLAKVDECQDWADKAQAMASYARQANDDSLHKMAVRIQARAIRRCGELLAQVPEATGAHLKRENSLPLSRTQVAADAGLSEHQRKTALRVANVPAESFEKQVESERPPTVSKLAEQGQKAKPRPHVDLGTIKPHDYARATQALGTLRAFAQFVATNDPVEIAAGVKPHEVKIARANIEAIDLWLDKFVTSLKEE